MWTSLVQLIEKKTKRSNEVIKNRFFKFVYFLISCTNQIEYLTEGGQVPVLHAPGGFRDFVSVVVFVAGRGAS